MAFKAIPLPQEPEPSILEAKFLLNGGLNINDLPQKLSDNQSPELKNVWYADNLLSKRYGQKYVFESDIETPIHKIHEKLYQGKRIFAAGTKLYSWNPSTNETIVIYSSLTSKKGCFYVVYDKLYYKNGVEWVVYDGLTCTTITPYIPIVYIGRTPTGGGNKNEDYNRAGAGFTIKVNGNGSATVYTLPQTNLDATEVTVEINGAIKTEGVHFTVDRVAGTVNFAAGSSPNGAPATGTDNVEITAYKTNITERDGVFNCKYAIEYGDNKNIVFMCGNGTGEVYWTEIGLPTYVRSRNTNNLGDNTEDCYGLGIQYSVLCIFKPRTIFSVTQITTDTSIAEFAFKIVNDSVGCDIPNSIQLINNRLVWANTYGGVYTLTSTDLQNEKNVKPLSQNVNGVKSRPGLLQEPLANLITAISYDYISKSQYWLCVGDKVYMWDYGLTPYVDTGDLEADQRRLSWWYFDNISANCFYEESGTLFYGCRDKGNIVQFVQALNDFDNAIDAFYTLPARDFGTTSYLKTIKLMNVTSRSDTFSTIYVEYITDRDRRVDPQPLEVGSFSWASFSWAVFTWSVVRIGKSFPRYPNSKHVLYWAARFSNNDVGRDLNIIDIEVKWINSKRVR